MPQLTKWGYKIPVQRSETIKNLNLKIIEKIKIVQMSLVKRFVRKKTNVACYRCIVLKKHRTDYWARRNKLERFIRR